MLGWALRSKVKNLCMVFARPFAALGIHPNLVSMLGIVFALAAASFILEGRYLVAFGLALLAGLMDLIDGSVAKLLNKRSHFGNYFDAVVDKFVEFFLYAGFAPRYPLETSLAIGFALIASYAKPRVGLVVVTDNRDWPTIGEHAERLLVFMAGLLASAFVNNIGGFKPMLLAFYAIMLLSGVGSVQRILFAKKLIVESERKNKILPYLKQGKERQLED